MEVSKLEIAKIQLERAIVLMLDNKNYISAITLAGASGDILGNLLRAQGDLSTYDHLKIGFERLAKLRQGRSPDKRTFNDLENGIRNGLKHYQDGSPMHFDPELAAADILDRAVSDLWKLTHEETKNMERFKHYHMRRGQIANEA